jgi:hypothetical protein
VEANVHIKISPHELDVVREALQIHRQMAYDRMQHYSKSDPLWAAEGRRILDSESILRHLGAEPEKLGVG